MHINRDFGDFDNCSLISSYTLQLPCCSLSAHADDFIVHVQFRPTLRIRYH